MPKITPETKIAIGIPRGKDGFYWEWIECLLKMFAKHPARYTPLSEQRPHAQARNEIVERFLRGDAEYLLWIDSDTIWEPNDIQSLMDVLDHGADIATGIQFAAGSHRLPIIRRLNLEYGVMEPIAKLPEGGVPFEIDGCGFGFILMRRKVLETIKAPWFEFRQGFSEDLNFCLLAKLAGFRIWAHPGVLLGHIAPKVWTVRDFLDVPEEMRIVYAQNSLAGTNSYLKKMHPEWRKELQLDKLIDSDNIGENLNLKEGYWDNVYKTEVEGNFNWRTYPGKFPFIAKELMKDLPENAKVLELGAGLGILLEEIRKQHPNFELMGMDISAYGVEQMKRKGFIATEGTLPNWLKDRPENTNDCIIATETLEHLDDKERAETVQESCRLLKKGGLAIFTVPDNTMPPSELAEHRVCYDKETFKAFLNASFTGQVEVYSKKCLVSDVKRPDNLQWAEAPFLFGLCMKD
jgi:2-polyprenyl-3-methyl-5-hydroxy-6-metoxy-1,4-benzoquinol methylase